MSFFDLIDDLAYLERKKRENKLEQYIPYPKQLAFHNAIGKDTDCPASERMLFGGNQVGKFLRFDEPILTPNGWTSIELLKVGDEVISVDGSITKVTGVYPQGVQPLYKFTFDWGQEVINGLDHLWQVTLPNARFKMKDSHGISKPNKLYGKQTVVNTKTLIDMYKNISYAKQRVAMPYISPVQFKYKEVPIDPYLLGAILGDGGFTSDSITFSSIDKQILDIISSESEKIGLNLSHRTGCNYAIVKKSGNLNILKRKLDNLGLMGKYSYEKSIPKEYLFNSPDVRLGILQGLMDTDGTINKKGVISFTSTSIQLAEDVKFLIQSFGGKARISSRFTSYTYKNVKKQGRKSYTVRIHLSQVKPFRLQRKLDRCIESPRNCSEHILHSIEQVEDGEAVCISVEHPSSLYVTRDCIVTHNTHCGSIEAAIHLTGLYPDWWEGRRFNHPVEMLAAGKTNITVRDVMQKALFGDPMNSDEMGTGAVPKKYIKKFSKKPGVINAFDTVQVQHYTNGIPDGTSNLYLRGYEAGKDGFMGSKYQVIWLDEEPHQEIYSQCIRAGLAQVKPIIYLTMTPETGMTNVVTCFLNDLQEGQHVSYLTWDDALHMTDEDKRKNLAKFPEHEREMRKNGSPLMGAGLIFNVPDSLLVVEPFDIPKYWCQIIGVDFGWDHPFGACKWAWDRDTDTVYLVAEYREAKAVPAVHAQAIRGWGDFPIVWPHDGLNTEKGTGEQLIDKYREVGLNMFHRRTTSPPPVGKAEGEGGIKVEESILEMNIRMQEGRLKIFSTCKQWLEEKRMYHRDEKARIVKVKDDLISASRYGIMMLRHARTSIVRTAHKQTIRKGRRNFGG